MLRGCASSGTLAECRRSTVFAVVLQPVRAGGRQHLRRAPSASAAGDGHCGLARCARPIISSAICPSAATRSALCGSWIFLDEATGNCASRLRRSAICANSAGPHGICALGVLKPLLTSSRSRPLRLTLRVGAMARPASVRRGCRRRDAPMQRTDAGWCGSHPMQQGRGTPRSRRPAPVAIDAPRRRCLQAWPGARSVVAPQCQTAAVASSDRYRFACWLPNLNCFTLLRIGVGAPRRTGRSPARMPSLSTFYFGG